MISLLKCAKSRRENHASLSLRLDMTLDWDVLLHVLALADSLDAASLMATCKLLYHEGARIILARPVHLMWREKIASFLVFLEAENGTCLCFLRELHFTYVHNTCPLAMTRLAAAVQRTHNLETLGLGHIEYLLPKHPDFIQNLMGLTSLKSLTLHSAGPIAHDFLLAIPSRVVYLNVSWSRWYGRPLPAEGLMFQVLNLFAESLEELKWDTSQYAIPPATARGHVVYPQLRRLTISRRDLLQLLAPVCVIPNLIHLSLVGPSPDTSVPLFLPDDSTGWRAGLSHLEDFDGSVYELYSISQFTSHIPQLNLHRHADNHRRDGDDWFLLRDVLLRARPVEVTYQARVPFSQDVKALCAIDGGKDALTHLDLKLNIHDRDERGAGFDRALEDLTAWLLSIPRLRHLKLNLVVDMHNPGYLVKPPHGPRCRCPVAPLRWRWRPPWSRKVVQGWLAFDVRSFAQSLVDQHPAALKRVEVVLSRPQCECQRSAAITEGGEVIYSEIRGTVTWRR